MLLDDIKKADEEARGGGDETTAPPEAPPKQEDGWHWEAPEWLKAKTGEGPVESYMEHPLCFAKETWNARLVRGLSGMLGNLDFAVVDIIVAVVELVWAKRKQAASAAKAAGGPPNGPGA